MSARGPASVTLRATEATIYVGQKADVQTVVKASRPLENDGRLESLMAGRSRIMESTSLDAIWTVIMSSATSKENPAAKAVVKATVVTKHETTDWLRNAKP